MELGFPELVIILVLVLVLFGSSKLPALGEGLGKAIRGFKTALADGADAPAPAKDSPPADDAKR